MKPALSTLSLRILFSSVLSKAPRSRVCPRFSKAQPLWLFPHEDQIAPARILNKFAKDSDGKFVIKSGYMDGKVMSPAEIAAIADLPSKEGLVQMLLSVLVSARVVLLLHLVKLQRLRKLHKFAG